MEEETDTKGEEMSPSWSSEHQPKGHIYRDHLHDIKKISIQAHESDLPQAEEHDKNTKTIEI